MRSNVLEGKYVFTVAYITILVDRYAPQAKPPSSVATRREKSLE